MLGKFRALFAKPSVEVSLSEISSLVLEAADSQQKEKLASLRQQAESELAKLDSMLAELAGKQTADNYVNVLKERFCEKGRKALAGMPDSFGDFLGRASAALTEISGISLKEFRHFHAFRDDMARIAAQVKLAEERVADMSKAYSSSAEKRISEIEAAASALAEKQAAISRLAVELAETERAVPFLKEALESDERKLSEASGKLQSIAAEALELAESLESERSIIKQRIGTEFGSIDKLLKRLQHESPKKYATISGYISNAGSAFMSDDEMEIRTVLEELKPALRREDPEKHEKVTELLRNMDFFDSLREQYRGISARLAGARSSSHAEAAPLEKEKSHLMLSIEEKNAEIAQLMERRAAKAAEKERLEKETASGMAEIARLMQDLLQREVVVR